VKRLSIALGLLVAAVGALLMMRRSGDDRSDTWTPVDPS
jgi:hypothetical protein